VIFLLSAGSFLFGWAKPVPVSTSGLRNPKRDMIVVAAAGPAMNLVMASFWTLVLAVSLRLGDGGMAGDFLQSMAQVGIFFNILLAVFNLLPLPPLDGGRVLRGLVPESIGRRLDAIEPFGLIIIVLLLTAGVIGPLMWPLITSLQGLLFRIASILGG
jgi:Zn-dependent protease